MPSLREGQSPDREGPAQVYRIGTQSTEPALAIAGKSTEPVHLGAEKGELEPAEVYRIGNQSTESVTKVPNRYTCQRAAAIAAPPYPPSEASEASKANAV